MRSVLKRNPYWLKFAAKVFVCVLFVNLLMLPLLWMFNILPTLILVIIYEGAILAIVGGVQLLLSFVHYRRNSDRTIDQRYPYPGSGWLDHRILFRRLNPEERKRYRQEGRIIVIFGFILWATAVIMHFLLLINWAN
jgi:hypothetical protein